MIIVRHRLLTFLILFICSSLCAAPRSRVKIEPALIEEYKTMRDPFKQPSFITAESKQKSELERFNLTEFKLIAVVTGPKKFKAMVVSPAGKTHFVTLKDKIGNREGVIKKILPDRIVVQEKLVNVLGQEDKVMSELKIVGEKGKQSIEKSTESNPTDSQSANGTPNQ